MTARLAEALRLARESAAYADGGEVILQLDGRAWMAAAHDALAAFDSQAPQPARVAPGLVDALRAIRDQRDYHAEHGHYRPGTMSQDQQFDDWAADIADTVLAAFDSQAPQAARVAPGDDVAAAVALAMQALNDVVCYPSRNHDEPALAAWHALRGLAVQS